MNDIVLVKADPIINQSSIRAELFVKSLKKKYSVLSLGWDRGEGRADKSNSLKIFRLSAPYGRTLRYLMLLPIFWAWVFINLCLNKPKIIHACNLDTIIPCYIYKSIFETKLVFDLHDRYAMSFIPRNKGKFFDVLYTLVNSFEENIANRADLLIIVYQRIFETFRKKPRNCIAIMVCPEDVKPNNLKAISSDFKILFTGHVRVGRGLESLLDIIRDIHNTELLIVGRVEDKQLLKKIDTNLNAKYLGFLNRTQLVNLEQNSDALIALYDLNLQTQHRYGMANKILEAMMCGLPVITNIGDELIKETECGILVDYDNNKQIKEAIIALRDNYDLRLRLGKNGRSAFVHKYNWPSMESRLLKSYKSLLALRN